VWSNDKFKYSSKGVQKCRAMFNKQQYLNCQNLRQHIMSTNMGFRRHNGVFKTYVQNKIGLTPIYTKGIVMNNGINITPLNI